MTHPDPEHQWDIFTTYLAGNTPGLSTALGEAPENPSPAYPYLVVTPLTPFQIEGALNDGNETQVIEGQVTSIGLTTQQALGGIAAARDRMLATPGPDFTAFGYKKTGNVKISPGAAFESEQADQPPLFLANETYRMVLTPV